MSAPLDYESPNQKPRKPINWLLWFYVAIIWLAIVYFLKTTFFHLKH